MRLYAGMYYSTDAIVLKSIPAGEYDARYVLYTADFGKIVARANGIKKENAKLKGHLETLALTRIGLVSGARESRLIAASLIRFWDALRDNPDKLAAAMYCLSLVDTHCMAGERDDVLWERLVAHMDEIAERTPWTENDGTDVKRAFEAMLLGALGYGGEKNLRALPTYIV